MQATADQQTIGHLLARYVELAKLKKSAASEVDTAETEMKQIEPQLLELMGGMGMDSSKVAGMTVYRKRNFYASKKGGVEKEQFIDALKGYEPLHDVVGVTYNASSLKARVKEIEENGETLPPHIAEMLNTGETMKLVCRKA